jgi:hypothetical protein
VVDTQEFLHVTFKELERKSRAVFINKANFSEQVFLVEA